MGIEKDIKELLEGLSDGSIEIGGVEMGTEEKREIGDLPPDLKAKNEAMYRDKTRMAKEMKFRMEQYAREAKHKLEMEFDEKQDEMAERKEAFWQEVYQHFDLDPEGSYTASADTHKVYEKVEKSVKMDGEMFKRKNGPVQ